MLEEFLSYLEEQVKNHSIYIWGAQGQGYPTVNEEWIRKKESGDDLERALACYRKAAAAGYEKLLRAFDCSGLGMYWIQNLKGLSETDMNAHGMKGKCKLIDKSELKRGDWVFRTYKSGANKGRAYHIGYVVDDSLNVIEAKGRAYGVVKRAFDASYWNAYGRPEYFRAEIETTPQSASLTIDNEQLTMDNAPNAKESEEKMELTRNLKKGMRGEDVEELQRLLNEVLGTSLDDDGIFGSKTEEAVKAFQKSEALTVDGICGKKTWAALTVTMDNEQLTMDNASNANKEVPVGFSFTRNLKKGMSGADVKELQGILGAQGFNAGSADGIFGSKTQAAVKAAQKKHHLTADGIAGKHTITALGGTWGNAPGISADTITICTFNIKRGTYRNGTHKIIGGIVKDADIVGIQEVTPGGLKNIAGHAGKSSHMCETISGYGHAVLTNFGASSEEITTLSGTGERRKVHHLQFGDVSYYNTHFHYTEPTCSKQLNELAGMLGKDTSKVVIVTGDFNRQTFDALTLIGFRQANTGQAIANTESGASIVNKIDNVFVRGGLITDVWKYEAVSKGYSDHDALFIKVKL